MKEKLYILIIVVFFCSVILLVLEIIKIVKEHKLEIAKIQKEICELNHSLDIGKYLLEAIPEDDDWEPNDNFVKKCVEECKKQNINATEKEVWDYFQP